MGFGEGRIMTTKLVLDFAEVSKLSLPFYHSIKVMEPCVYQSKLDLLEDAAMTAPELHFLVADETNPNLTAAQRKLLLKHWTYGHAHLH